MSDEILLTDIEAAEHLRINRARLVRLARRGVVPHILLPDNEIRFRRSDLVEWVANYRQPAEEAKQ
jgi:excisionase family DNA binding protein